MWLARQFASLLVYGMEVSAGHTSSSGWRFWLFLTYCELILIIPLAEITSYLALWQEFLHVSFPAAVPYLEHKVTTSPRALLLFRNGVGWRCCSSTQWEKGAGEGWRELKKGRRHREQQLLLLQVKALQNTVLLIPSPACSAFGEKNGKQAE